MTESTQSLNQDKAPLEDLMVAMDVVDTLRHHQVIVDRELGSDERRQNLFDRLRQIYSAQGIEVTDRVLLEGINALEEDRFHYERIKPSFATRLAHWYVRRKKWSKPIGFLAVLASLFTGVYFVDEVLPERRLRDSLPSQIDTTFDEIKSIAKKPEIVEIANEQLVSAQAAINSDNLETAEELSQQLSEMLVQLRQSYDIRVVSRPNESSGVWRVPDVNQASKNYYLIVEAVDRKNKVVKLPILSEESGKTKLVSTWGLRVNERTFYQIADDKTDDGIIQLNKVGSKQAGYLMPTFNVPTTGASITQW